MEKNRIPLVFVLVLISFQLCFAEPLFYESFDEPFEGSWIVSQKDEYSENGNHAKSEGHDDYGLLVSETTKKYAIVKELDDAVSLKDGTIVLQFETRLLNGLGCGGAYLKCPQEAGWKSKEFDNEFPCSIMFGPDKCGSTNKAHFIFKHKNPKTVCLREALRAILKVEGPIGMYRGIGAIGLGVGLAHAVYFFVGQRA